MEVNPPAVTPPLSKIHTFATNHFTAPLYDLVKWRISVGEGLLQMGLPFKEAAQLTDPGKDGIYTRCCTNRVHLKGGRQELVCTWSTRST